MLIFYYFLLFTAHVRRQRSWFASRMSKSLGLFVFLSFEAFDLMLQYFLKFFYFFVFFGDIFVDCSFKMNRISHGLLKTFKFSKLLLARSQEDQRVGRYSFLLKNRFKMKLCILEIREVSNFELVTSSQWKTNSAIFLYGSKIA